MQVTLTNLSSTTPVYITQLYKQLAPLEAITVRRTMAQIDADSSLKALIVAGSVGITYTEEAGDDIAGGGGLEAGVAKMECIRHAFAAGAGGAPDDVAIYTADAPFEFEIVDVTLIVSTLVNPSTVTVRDTAGGAGAALSDALVSTTTGVKRNAAMTTTPTVLKGGTVVLRRSDSGVAGIALLHILRKS